MQRARTRRFYPPRRVLLALACASPVVLLAGLWWFVSAVVLVPAVPGEDAGAQACVEFVAHERGLPRLDQERQTALIETQMRRLVEEEGFREGFVSALRRSSSEDLAAFRAHLFEALKPRVLFDVRKFHELPDESRRPWLDERLVDYKRLERLLRSIRIDKDALGTAFTDARSWLGLVLAKTTEDERELGVSYFSALARRAEEILQEPDLKRQFEQRLGFAIP